MSSAPDPAFPLGWDIAPFGMYKLTKWIDARYSPRGGIVITENGFPSRDDTLTGDEATRDTPRACYIKLYLQVCHYVNK